MASVPASARARAARIPSSIVSPATNRSTTDRVREFATMSRRMNGSSASARIYTSPVDTSNQKLAILGCGKIGEILLAGLLASGWRKPDEIVVTARREERARDIAERHGVRATTSNPEAVREARVLVV